MARKWMKYWRSDKKIIKDPSQHLKAVRTKEVMGMALIVFLAIACMVLLRFDLISSMGNLPKAFARFIKLYLPPNFEEIKTMLEAMWLTLLIAVSAGSLGSVLAYFAALGMSKQTGKIPLLKFVLRVVATFVRNVPAPIFAIVLLMAFWYGEFLALLVMTLATFGFNARLYSDMIDETNTDSIEALEASGASYWQIVTQSVIPETLPTSISWTLYAIELNIRAATIIGMLVGGGIGHLIGIYKHFRRFDQLMAAVILVVVVIIIFDQVSMYIRKRVL